MTTPWLQLRSVARVFLVWRVPSDRRERKRPTTAAVLWPFLTTNANSRRDRAAA